ncbi:hypothetical protein [Sodalis sp.]
MLPLKPNGRVVALGQVKLAETPFKRFDTAAMSTDTLNPKAHESLA